MADAADSDEDVSINYEDALGALDLNPALSSEMPNLTQSLEDCTTAFGLFLNNKFSEALILMKPWSERSMYHSLGYGTILYFQAMMTFETKHIETAIDCMKRSVALSNLHRRKLTVTDSISQIVKGTNYNSYTDVEAHAELCYAESLLERALLSFVQDENLVSFLKGGLKIRSCYHSFKECLQILKHRRTWQNEFHKSHFESGVRMGVGAFNLLISCLPSKILKLLEFIGFSGSRTYGLKELDIGYRLNPGLRAPLCALILIVYHTVVTYFIGLGDGDLDYATSVLNSQLELYPKGVLFLFFAGRLEEIKGNMSEAIVWLRKAVDSQHEWRQYHHLCYWELIFRRDWSDAANYSNLLIKESFWSKTTYCYQKAAFLCMMGNDLSEEQKVEINNLMTKLPKYKQRIAGKSLPMEKFAIKKSQRFLQQNNRLILTAYELMYVWNAFIIVGKKIELLAPILGDLEREEMALEVTKESNEFYVDEFCLIQLLKGVVLKHMNSPLQAQECFQTVWKNEKKLKDDIYLAPFALVELAHLFIDKENYVDATQLLEAARSNFKGISLESRLHFKIHSGLTRIRTNRRSPTNLSPTSFSEANSSNGNTSPVTIAGDACSISSNGSSNISLLRQFQVDD
uniref:Tetratricopeptide repeat protein 39B n=1 Tax=Strigamia maritima TaxID=126957 RepID=T1IHC5_STRMM